MGKYKVSGKLKCALAKAEDAGADARVEAFLASSVTSGSFGEGHAAVKHWMRYHETIGKSPVRVLDPVLTTLDQKSKEEWHCMKFCEWLCTAVGVSSETSEDYMSRINAWHTRRHGIGLAGGMQMARIKMMLRGIARTEVAKPKVARVGVRPQLLASALDEVLGPRGKAGAAAQNYRAAAVVSFAALLRGCEGCLQDGKQWSALNNASRNDVTPRASGAMTVGIRPAKKLDLASLRNGVKHHVPLARGSLLDPCAELEALYEVDKVPRNAWGSTPLFRDPANNAPIRVSQLRKLVKMLMKAVGRDPDRYGAHSLRIGGATALFAQGASPVDIKALGRWSSDCFEIYIRTCEHSARSAMARALSEACYDVADTIDDFDMELDKW